MPKAKKALVVLTTFWDANTIIENGYFIFKVQNGVYRANMFIGKDSHSTYTVESIALSHPDLKKLSKIDSLDRIDFWCPTYNILHDYHQDKDWEKYVVRYKEIMKSRNEKIKEWIESLVPDHIYILCCWENTSKEAHCHRQLIFDALNKSDYAKQKLLPVYRDGINKREHECKAENESPANNAITIETNLELPF